MTMTHLPTRSVRGLAPNTVDQLDACWERRQRALAEGNAEAAERAILSADHILDIRLRPIAVTADGEALFEGASSWEVEQAGGVAAIPPAGGVAESPFTREDIERWTHQARRELGMGEGS